MGTRTECRRRSCRSPGPVAAPVAAAGPDATAAAGPAAGAAWARAGRAANRRRRGGRRATACCR